MTMNETDASLEPRKRSIDNLQRLYTVTISLAVAEILRRVFVGPGAAPMLPQYHSVLALVSFVVTVVPFYHGANRYLDAAYVTGESPAKHGALMLDFMALFVEGMAFFVLSIFVDNSEVYYTLLASLFVFDAIWVWLTRLLAEKQDSDPGYVKWAIANIVAAVAIWLSVWANLWMSYMVRQISLVIIVVLRTSYDYYSVWPFYYPRPAQPQVK